MRKLLVAVAILSLPFLSAESCDQPKICKPYAVRKDANGSGTWWVCNKTGTREDPLKGVGVNGDTWQSTR